MRGGLFHRSGPVGFAVVVGVVLSCGSIREDEMLCEEAASHLDDCCPEIDPRRLNCVYDQGCSDDLVPVLTAEASDCLLGRSCEELQQRGLCNVMRRLSYTPYTFQDRGEFEREACR